MKLPDRVYLIGLPGSGKSTLGRQLAERYGVPFLDTDALIEQQVGISIPQLFQQGEAIFRQHEREALASVAQNSSGIISCGGGLPCFHDNLEVLRASGLVLWLDVPLSELTDRLMDSPTSRPLLASVQHEPNPREALYQKLAALNAARRPFYSQAHIRLHGRRLSADDLQRSIRAHLHLQGHQ